MRLLIQRVGMASVRIEGAIVGQIGRGFVVLAGFRREDPPENIPRLAEKCLNLRVFEDADGKMNHSLLDVKGELLVISQFTLFADCRKGRRPGFDIAMPPNSAERHYNALVEELRRSGLRVETGRFGAKMDVELVNNGPVTILLDSDEI